MKHKLLVAGLSSIVVAAVLYTLGYTSYNTMVDSYQVLIFPAAFFALLGLVLLYRAVRYALKSG